MKIKVKTTFRRAFSLLLCMVMLFGIAPFSSMVASASATTYKITCYQSSDSDVILWQANYAEGKALDLPANVQNPTRAGYTFKHWSVDIPATMPAHDISTTAQWTPLPFTITFASDGFNNGVATEGYNNGVYTTITQGCGSDITPPANPTRAGYTFAGWDQKIPAKMPSYNMTITAKWTLAKASITFDGNGGSYTNPIVLDFGEAIPTVANPTREGHTFTGWVDKATGLPATVPTSMPANSITLVAQWKIEQYTISFKTNGGTDIKPITQDYNTVIVKPEDPKRVGYTFNGWSTDIPERMPARNMEIEAYWVPNEVEISYDPNGGYVENIDTADPTDLTDKAIKVKYTYGKPFAAPENSVLNPDNPVRSGYTFLGWYDITGTVARPPEVPSVPTTYYAKWSEGTGGCFYKVNTYRMDENGKYQLASENLFSAAAGTVTAEYTVPAGFILDEVDDGPDANGNRDTSISKTSGTLTSANGVNNPLQLSVYLKRKTYTITFNVAGGTAIAPIEALYGSVVTAPANPTKKGYIFDCWINDSTGKPDTIPNFMPVTNTSFTAKWIPQGDTPYKVIVKYKDVTDGNKPKTEYFDFTGTTGSKVKISITNSATAEPGVKVHKVSEFDVKHYKLDTTTIANQVLEATIAADGSTELILEYIPVNYKVTFTAAGKVVSTKEVQYFKHADTVVPSDMDTYFAKELPGYTFKGWEPELNTVTGDVEYKALFNSNPYTVKFNYAKVVKENGQEFTTSTTPDAGQELADITQGFNTTFVVPQCPTKAGYSLVLGKKTETDNLQMCWYDVSTNPHTVYYPGEVVVMPKEGLTLTAKYTANRYYINFNTDGGTYVAPVSALCDDEVTLPAYPTKDGNKCVGWYAADGTRYEEGATITMPAYGLYLTARWDTGKFNIIYKDGEETVYTDRDIEFNTDITAYAYPPKTEDYTGNKNFIGWREKGKTGFFFPWNEKTGKYDATRKMPGYSLVLEPVWGYTITFLDENGGLIKRVALEPGAKITAPDIPYVIGTTATWGTQVPSVMPDHDVVIKVNRMYNDYKITYMNGDKVYKQETYKYGQTITPVEAPKKCFKAFEGWNAEIPATMPDHDITVSAVWSNNTNFVKAIQSFFGTLVNIFNMILKIFS